jgi:hypothetical protein
MATVWSIVLPITMKLQMFALDASLLALPAAVTANV